MLGIDRSLPVQTGKTNDALALPVRHAEFLTHNTRTTGNPEIFMEVLGNLDTIHLVPVIQQSGSVRGGRQDSVASPTVEDSAR
jgi:hypothetical protein